MDSQDIDKAYARKRINDLESACEIAKATLIAIKGDGKLTATQDKWVEDALAVLRAAIAVKGKPNASM